MTNQSEGVGMNKKLTCAFIECPSPVYKHGYCADHQDMVEYYGMRKGILNKFNKPSPTKRGRG
jgi:hypothetical protein